MTVAVKVPDLGESISEATVGRWLVDVGTRVEVGDPVVELETDKVDLEVGAQAAGILTEIAVEAGKDVRVGDVLGQIDPVADGEISPQESAGERGGDLAAAETRAVERPGPRAAGGPEPGEGTVAEDQPSEGAQAEGVTASPVAERLAREHGIALEEIEGSGTDGRIVKSDVEDAIARGLPGEKPMPAVEGPRKQADAQARGQTVGERARGPEERQKMSRRRRTIARRMVEAQRQAAILTTFNDVDMGAVMGLRAEQGERFRARHGVSLGITSFFARAAAIALTEYPDLNASVDGDFLIRKYYYDIGIAVGAEDGLVVPVVRDVDRRPFAEIELEINELARRAHAGELTLDDLQGGTFSITNGGVYGSLLSTPILNPPQVAILGLHRIEDRPAVAEGQVVIKPMMYVALSYDHRVVDGRQAVQFLDRVKQLVEAPGALAIES